MYTLLGIVFETNKTNSNWRMLKRKQRTGLKQNFYFILHAISVLNGTSGTLLILITIFHIFYFSFYVLFILFYFQNRTTFSLMREV